MADLLPFSAPTDWTASTAIAPKSGPVAKPAAPAAPKEAAKPAPAPTPPPPPAAPQAPAAPSASMEAAKKVDALEKDSMKLNAPTLHLPPKPEPKMTSPQEMWGSTAMIFAGLAGLMTRRPMVTAMNAATAAINGFKAKDQAATDQAMKVWETETKNAIELSKFQREAYDTALAGVRHREDLAIRTGDLQEREATAKVAALAAAMKDPMMSEAIKKGPDEAVKLQKMREDVEQKNIDAKNSMNKYFLVHQATEALKDDPEWGSLTKLQQLDKTLEIEEKIMGSSRHISAFESPQQQNALYKALVEGVEPPATSGPMMRDPNYRKVLTRAQENPNYDPNKFLNTKIMEKNLESGADGKTLLAIDTANNHLNAMETLVDNIPTNSDITTKNALAVRYAKEFGLVGVTDFESFSQLVAGEVVKAMTGGEGGGQTERQETAGRFSPSLSHEVLKSNISAYRVGMGGKAEPLYNKYSGQVPDKFRDKYFTPEVMAYVKAEKDAKDKQKVEKEAKAHPEKATTPSAASLAVSPKTETAKPEPAKTEAVPAGATPYSLKNPDGSTKQVYVVGKKIFNMDGTPYTKAP